MLLEVADRKQFKVLLRCFAKELLDKNPEVQKEELAQFARVFLKWVLALSFLEHFSLSPRREVEGLLKGGCSLVEDISHYGQDVSRGSGFFSSSYLAGLKSIVFSEVAKKSLLGFFQLLSSGKLGVEVLSELDSLVYLAIFSARGKRNKRGAFNTPQWLAKKMAEDMLGGKGGSESSFVLDPSCGSGLLLVEAAKVLSGVKKQAVADIVCEFIYGVDISEFEVETTRVLLWLISSSEEIYPNDFSRNIKVGNSLVSSEDVDKEKYFVWENEFKEVFSRGGFSLVLGNPPFLNAVEESTKLSPAVISHLRERFSSACGTFDSSVVFQELSFFLLREAGVSALVVPNKLLSADFALELRKYLTLKASCIHVDDYSNLDVFSGAAVYPIVLKVEKKEEIEDNKSRDVFLASSSRFVSKNNEKISEVSSVLKRSDFLSGDWGGLFSSSPKEFFRIKKEVPKIGDFFTVTASASASEAYKLKECLVDDREVVAGDFLFLTTGLIDKGVSLHGCAVARYLGNTYQSPLLRGVEKIVSEKRLCQYRSDKILLAGLSNTLEAVCVGKDVVGAVSTVQLIAKGKADRALLERTG